jgi:hypothetical protein
MNLNTTIITVITSVTARERRNAAIINRHRLTIYRGALWKELEEILKPRIVTKLVQFNPKARVARCVHKETINISNSNAKCVGGVIPTELCVPKQRVRSLGCYHRMGPR